MANITEEVVSDDAVWKRLDNHSMKIEDIARQQATATAEIRALERRLDNSLSQFAESLARIETKLDNTASYQNKQKGAAVFGAWVIGTALTVVATVAVVWSVVFGN